jgi:hypothetical protein
MSPIGIPVDRVRRLAAPTRRLPIVVGLAAIAVSLLLAQVAGVAHRIEHPYGAVGWAMQVASASDDLHADHDHDDVDHDHRDHDRGEGAEAFHNCGAYDAATATDGVLAVLAMPGTGAPPGLSGAPIALARLCNATHTGFQSRAPPLA